MKESNMNRKRILYLLIFILLILLVTLYLGTDTIIDFFTLTEQEALEIQFQLKNYRRLLWWYA